MKIDIKRISHEVALDGGDRIVVLSFLDDPRANAGEKIQRNLFRLDRDNHVKWQVGGYEPLSSSTFTNLYWKEEELFAYNFDGVEYQIDLETGAATPKRLLK